MTKGPERTLAYIFLIFWAIIFIVPYFWLLSLSLRSSMDFFSPTLMVVPKNPSLQSYISLFKETEFLSWIMSSTIISVGTVAIGVFICSLGGYVFAKYKFAGRDILFWIILSSLAVPQIVLLVPLYIFMHQIALIDTYWAVILPYSVNIFGVFLIKQYTQSAVPDELLDAARIDGCSELSLFFRVVAPVIKPGLAVLALYLWLNSWSQFIWPLVMLTSPQKQTFTVGLSNLFKNTYQPLYDQVMAGSFLSTLPLVLVFILMQKRFVSGLLKGAVK